MTAPTQPRALFGRWEWRDGAAGARFATAELGWFKPLAFMIPRLAGDVFWSLSIGDEHAMKDGAAADYDAAVTAIEDALRGLWRELGEVIDV